MVRVGSLFICDRCGKEHFYENKHGCIRTDRLNGWGTYNYGDIRSIGLKDLCPECADKLDTLIKNFYGIIEKEISE